MQPAANTNHIDVRKGDSCEVVDRLKRAMTLALELETLLQPHGLADNQVFRLRLARAHVLSAIDSFTDLILHLPPPVPQSGVYEIDRA